MILKSIRYYLYYTVCVCIFNCYSNAALDEKSEKIGLAFLVIKRSPTDARPDSGHVVVGPCAGVRS